nr:hypothetical protein [Tahibacter caeni]
MAEIDLGQTGLAETRVDVAVAAEFRDREARGRARGAEAGERGRGIVVLELRRRYRLGRERSAGEAEVGVAVGGVEVERRDQRGGEQAQGFLGFPCVWAPRRGCAAEDGIGTALPSARPYRTAGVAVQSGPPRKIESPSRQAVA